MFKTLAIRFAMSLLILSASIQTVRAEEAKAPKWYDTVTFSGLVDAYYSYNSNTPGPGTPSTDPSQAGQNKYHNFDFKANDLDVGLVELNIVKPVDDKNPAGFYFGLVFGPTADAINNVNVPVSDPASYKNFRQAYASLLLAPGLQLDFGKFVTQHGAEVIESNANWNYTRSILFAWAIPYYHSGARLTYTLNDMLSVQGNISNGWNNVAENNNGKTYGIQAMVTPVKSLPIIINYMTGPENITGGGSDTRSILDIVATYNVTDSLSLMANYDDGTQKQAAGTGTSDAKWSGYAVYAKYAFASSYAAAVRYEQFDDKDGFMTTYTGGQKLSEGTLTLEHATAGGCLIRLDLRQDKSDFDVFTKEDGTATGTQNTVTLGIVQTF